MVLGEADFWSNLPALVVAIATLSTVFVNIKKTNKLHSEVNSRLTELVAATASKSLLEGERIGRERERDRIAAETAIRLAENVLQKAAMAAGIAEEEAQARARELIDTARQAATAIVEKAGLKVAT